MKRMAYLIMGTTIAAFGMTFLIQAGLGNVILNVLWDGMSRKMPVTIGMASYITSLLMILFSIFFDRSQIKIGTVIHFLLFGALMDIFMVLPLTTTNLTMRLIHVLLGVLVLNIGIGIYAFADLGRGPYEGICFALSEKLNLPLSQVRGGLDFIFTLIGFMMGGLVGVATLVNIGLGGIIIQWTLSVLDYNQNNRPRRKRKIQSQAI